MSVLGGWIDHAFRLEAENAELRSTIESLLWWVVENRDLLELAQKQIDARPWAGLGERHV